MLNTVFEIENAKINNPTVATAIIAPKPDVNNNSKNAIIIIPKNTNKPIPKDRNPFLDIISHTLSLNLGAIQIVSIMITKAYSRTEIILLISLSIIVEVSTSAGAVYEISPLTTPSGIWNSDSAV